MNIIIPLKLYNPIPEFPSETVMVIKSIGQVFNNAHLSLLNKYGDPGKWGYLTTTTMKSWWLEEYNIIIIDNWDAMKFESEAELAMFLLRWS